MSQARDRHENLLLDFVIVIVAAALIFLASSFGLEAGRPATKGVGAVYGGLYIVYLGVLFLLSYFFGRACYVFTFLQFVCISCSCPRSRHMALFYFALGFGLGLSLLLTGLAGCSPPQPIIERCAAINAQFTNGTPLSQVVARLGQPDTMVYSQSLSKPADTNYYRVCVYHFDSGDIVICSAGGPPALLDLDKRRFIHAIVFREKK